MSFEKGDNVLFSDKHSEYDGEVGEIAQVAETMFGDETYTVTFEDGQEAGIPADSLEEAPEEETDDADAEDAEAE